MLSLWRWTTLLIGSLVRARVHAAAAPPSKHGETAEAEKDGGDDDDDAGYYDTRYGTAANVAVAAAAIVELRELRSVFLFVREEGKPRCT